MIGAAVLLFGDRTAIDGADGVRNMTLGAIGATVLYVIAFATGTGIFRPSLAPISRPATSCTRAAAPSVTVATARLWASPGRRTRDFRGMHRSDIEWISLGSNRYQEEVGPTYGDAEKEITAVMPEFAESLTEREIAQVAAFERHRFGGADEDTALTDCGL